VTDTVYTETGGILRCACGCAEFVVPLTVVPGGLEPRSGVVQCTNCRTLWRPDYEPYDGQLAWRRVEGR
jgi:hypothetical protein